MGRTDLREPTHPYQAVIFDREKRARHAGGLGVVLPRAGENQHLAVAGLDGGMSRKISCGKLFDAGNKGLIGWFLMK
jgi:hypothetical protein